jgi:hypothetical protein
VVSDKAAKLPQRRVSNEIQHFIGIALGGLGSSFGFNHPSWFESGRQTRSGLDVTHLLSSDHIPTFRFLG